MNAEQVSQERGLIVFGFLRHFPETSLEAHVDFKQNDDNQENGEIDDLSLGVEEVLLMAWEERKEKQEAKKVLSQLQRNYDVLQRKFADAENRIDKLR